MKWFRKTVDEREELEIMRIESSAYYVFLFGLAIAIIVQVYASGSIEYVVGELIVLLAGVGWAMVGYFRKGIWDYRTKPGIKSYFGYSLIAALTFGILILLARLFLSGEDLLTSLRYFFFYFIIIFSALFLTMALYGNITKRRRKKLEQQFDDTE